MGPNPRADSRQCHFVRADIFQQIFNPLINLMTFLGSFSDSETFSNFMKHKFVYYR